MWSAPSTAWIIGRTLSLSPSLSLFHRVLSDCLQVPKTKINHNKAEALLPASSPTAAGIQTSFNFRDLEEDKSVRKPYELNIAPQYCRWTADKGVREVCIAYEMSCVCVCLDLLRFACIFRVGGWCFVCVCVCACVCVLHVLLLLLLLSLLFSSLLIPNIGVVHHLSRGFSL